MISFNRSECLTNFLECFCINLDKFSKYSFKIHSYIFKTMSDDDKLNKNWLENLILKRESVFNHLKKSQGTNLLRL